MMGIFWNVIVVLGIHTLYIKTQETVYNLKWLKWDLERWHGSSENTMLLQKSWVGFPALTADWFSSSRETGALYWPPLALHLHALAGIHTYIHYLKLKIFEWLKYWVCCCVNFTPHLKKKAINLCGLSSNPLGNPRSLNKLCISTLPQLRREEAVGVHIQVPSAHSCRLLLGKNSSSELPVCLWK
jgi:hypothetical protein